jgi:hypothetical protein
MTPIRDEFDRWLEDEAPGLRQHWDSPELWPRIAGSLEAGRKQAPRSSPARGWLLAAAAAFLLLLPAALLWRTQPRDPALLTEDALASAQQAERAYAASIEQLAKLAAPRLQSPPSPAVIAWRERLLLLDSALASVRAEAARNPYNHHLQTELIAIYREKQQTLQDILRYDQPISKN